MAKTGVTKNLRWRHLAMVSAGPAMNALALALAWKLFPTGSSSRGWMVTRELFIWANLAVLIENLWPRKIMTPYGTLGSDGMKIWQALFKWNRIQTTRPRVQSKSVRWVKALLKWFLVIIMIFVIVTFCLLAGVMFFIPGNSAGAKFGGSGLMLLCALAGGWATYRIARRPVLRNTGAAPSSNIKLRGLEELKGASEWYKSSAERNRFLELILAKNFAAADQLIETQLSKFPNDILLKVYQADLKIHQEHYPSALNLYAGILDDVRAAGTAAYSCTIAAKFTCQIHMNHFSNLDYELEQYLSGRVSVAEQVNVLDEISTVALMTENESHLAAAEKWARKAMELAPGLLTLKGTLGAILAELNRDAEAEPLLNECYRRSPQMHDQGIAGLFLGLLEHRKGRLNEARKLINRSVVLYPEEWLIKRARKILPGITHSS